MIKKHEYVEYLLSTPNNYTCTNMADHKSHLSHDVVNDFLRQSRFSSTDLWKLVEPYIEDSASSYLLVDDSVQDKRYSRFIELVKQQYSGNEHGLVNGIGLVNMVHSSGRPGDFYPIDYRIYHPETDAKTKNDHFQQMFLRVITHKKLKARRIVFDAWYASLNNLKLIHRHGWTFFTTLKSNRLVSLSKEEGYHRPEALVLTETQLQTGVIVKLHKCPFMVRLFRIATTDGRTEYIITNDLTASVDALSAREATAVRWQIEDFHRGFKQLTGSEKCQCRKATAQRNHLACCFHAWVSLKVKAKKMNTTVYNVRKLIFKDFLSAQLAQPFVPAI